MESTEVIRWTYALCGYVHDGTEPPELCPVCGAHGIRITRAAELEAAIREALAHEGPALVEVITDGELV